jgi:hypothetical protein
MALDERYVLKLVCFKFVVVCCLFVVFVELCFVCRPIKVAGAWQKGLHYRFVFKVRKQQQSNNSQTTIKQQTNNRSTMKQMKQQPILTLLLFFCCFLVVVVDC